MSTSPLSPTSVQPLVFALPAPDISAWRAGNTGTEGVWHFDSGVPGRHVMISALVHGNELCGAWALKGLLEAALRPQKGRLTLAFCNLDAFDRFDAGNHDASRFTDEDLNRQWLDERIDAADTNERRRAAALRPWVAQADWLLDIHSMHEPSAPLLLTGVQPRNLALARAMRSPEHIVIDAGHGGIDPGKVGTNDALEKDINLALALKLRDKFKQDSIRIILTRDSDIGLYSEGNTNKKAEDMQNRCKIITEAAPIFTVSLHQNSYPSPEVCGAQVFYFGQSQDGKKLADTIQDSLIANVDPDNHRVAKANESYYLLKKTPTPTVIVECGFLSNPTEADLLLTDDYQNKLVNAIYIGIQNYLSESM